MEIEKKYKVEKLEEYKQRQREWRDISVAQLSNANNILTILSVGFLGFLTKQRENMIDDIATGFSSPILWQVIAVIFILISIAYGIAVLFTRLYDFRISRHLAFCRQRFYNERCKERKDANIVKGLPDGTLRDTNCCDRIKVFWETLFCKIDFISKSDIEKNDAKIRKRFNALRLQADVLGKSSWRWTKCQVLFFLTGVLIYVINQFLIKV